MKNISFDKNILYIGDKNIVFEDEIFQVKIEDDKIYVLLDIKPKEKLTYDDCNNVFCYSGKGRKIWHIKIRITVLLRSLKIKRALSELQIS